MKKISAFILLAVFTASAWAGISVQGHRGARAIRPENTLAAFDYALKTGVDVLEMDMAVTKDNVIVLSHEPEIEPLLCLASGGKKVETRLPIHGLTFSEVQSYDCGSLINPKFPGQMPAPGEKIPALEDVFKLVAASTDPAAKTVEFNIETKIYPAHPELSPEPKEFVKLFVTLVRKYGFEKRVILQSFDRRTLIECKKQAPKIRTAMLTSDNLIDFVPVAKAVKADIISPDYMWIMKEDVDALHKAGVAVIPWTLNDKAAWERAIALGVDGIISDDPASLIAFLKEKKLR